MESMWVSKKQKRIVILATEEERGCVLDWASTGMSMLLSERNSACSGMVWYTTLLLPYFPSSLPIGLCQLYSLLYLYQYLCSLSHYLSLHPEHGSSFTLQNLDIPPHHYTVSCTQL